MIRIPLTKGYVALIDDRDAALAKLNWHVLFSHGKPYAARRIRRDGKPAVEMLHQKVFGPCADHIDGDGLNCRRKNLREATRQENNANAGIRSDNTSGYKGVTWHERGPRGWITRIQVSGRRKHVGIYQDPITAAKAYDAAARAEFGSFACLNFPRRGERGCHG